jgi:triphosphoribosyl-dephospho-CoA synthase
VKSPRESWTSDVVTAAAQLACLLEASAEKPGNVTPSHSFANMGYEDFLRSASALGAEMGRAGARSVGETILATITARQRWTGVNTNLGLVLLFAPLARAALIVGRSLRENLQTVLSELTVTDAQQAYMAIRLASPGGMDASVDQQDVRAQPTITLRQAMALAADRDTIAAEYLNDYTLTFERTLPTLKAAQARGATTNQAIVQTFLELMAAVPDTLIARKRGFTTAQAVAEQAAEAIAAGGVFSAAGRSAIQALDTRLRQPADNSLNPGTTADLVAAALFVNLLEEQLSIEEKFKLPTHL